ncbi:MAG: 23S rRNA (guanosine(2251)-2'-O)-methyltransferase RlmB [Gammaproteobacteria bacterium]
MAKGKHTVYGVHSAAALLRSPQFIVQAWFERSSPGAALEAELKAAQVNVQAGARAQLDHLAGGERHQGIVLEVKPPREYNESHLKDLVAADDQLLLLVLDQVQDPRNLGACLRAADGAGAAAVVVPKDRAARLTAVVAKTASGAAYSVPLIRVTNLARSLRWLGDNGVRRVGFADGAEHDLYGLDLEPPVALVLGSEAEGLRRLTAESCDVLAAIPMHGSVASLNVAVAAGVALFEARRQGS